MLMDIRSMCDYPNDIYAKLEPKVWLNMTSHKSNIEVIGILRTVFVYYTNRFEDHNELIFTDHSVYYSINDLIGILYL